MAPTAANVNLSLGLVNLVVDLHTAISLKRSGSGLTNVCQGVGGKKHAPAKTNQTLACSVCANSDKATFHKAKEQGSDYVLVDSSVTDEAAEVAKQFKGQVNLTCISSVELEAATVSTDGMYYVSAKAPEGSDAAHAYALIVKWIKENPDIALISKYAVQSSVALYRLQVRRDGLVLVKYAWPSDVHQSPAVPSTRELDAGLLTQLDTMIRSQVKSFVPDEWANDSRKVIAEATGQVVQITPLTGTAAVMDLAALIAASTAARPKSRARRPIAKSA